MLNQPSKEKKQAIDEEIKSRQRMQRFWVEKLQKFARKINSNYPGGQTAAENFIKANIKWTVEEIGIDCTIECLKKLKPHEPPFRSDDLIKKFLKQAGSINAIIQYLEYMCLECGPTREQINENAILNKRQEEEKKGIEAIPLSIHE